MYFKHWSLTWQRFSATTLANVDDARASERKRFAAVEQSAGAKEVQRPTTCSSRKYRISFVNHWKTGSKRICKFTG